MAVRRWSHARTADVVVTVGMTYDRTTQGEVVVTTIYHYPGGDTREGDRHRAPVASGAQRVVPRIWDMLFEEVVRVQQELPNSVTLRMDPIEMDGWRAPVATLLRIVGHELDVPVEV